MNNKQSLIEKEALLKNAQKVLKEEFFGIDEQIDAVIDNIQPWLYFPEMQIRPTVINLWGMTGCGKSGLINRLIQLLDLKDHRVYFNFSQLSEQSSKNIEESLAKNLHGMGMNNPIFVLDEIQYAKTIDEVGKEISNSAMKTFWELMDSGIFTIPYEWHDVWEMANAYWQMAKLMQDDRIKIKNGQIVNGMAFAKKMLRDDMDTSDLYEGVKFTEEEREQLSADKQIATLFSFEVKEVLFKVLKEQDPKKYHSIDVVYDEIATFNKKQLLSYIERAKRMMMGGLTCDFSKGLVFILGNVDEAYHIYDDVNPDMSADQFHKMTKGISLIDIKKALQKRFRNEQIARFGNIHLIYPAFTSKTYELIINKELVVYAKDVKERFGIGILFDKSIHTILYKDGVFPTQGTRPIFTSVNEIVKTKLPQCMVYAVKNDIKFNDLVYTYKNKKVLVDFYQGTKKVGSLSIPQTLRVENLRHEKHENFQALCAVHETGHMIVNLALFNELPEKMCSVTAESDIGGFVLRKFDKTNILNKTNLIHHLAVNMGGRVAEELIFGIDNISSGASSDIHNSTNLAVRAVREDGFGDIFAKSHWYATTMDANKIYDKEEGDNIIKRFIVESKTKAEEILVKEKQLLLKVSEYLSNHPTITNKKLGWFIKEYYTGEVHRNLFTQDGYKQMLYKDILQKAIEESRA